MSDFSAEWKECFFQFNCLSKELCEKIKRGLAQKHEQRYPHDGFGSSDLNHAIYGAWKSAGKSWPNVLENLT